MKMQLKFMLLLIGVSSFLFTGCDKEKGVATTIDCLNLVNKNPKGAPIFTGTWIASGGINSSGTQLMFVVPETAHPGLIDCTLTLTAPEGTFDIKMHCSTVTNTGTWHIVSGSGSGLYLFLQGSGSLTMTFTGLPTGVISLESMAGKTFMDLK